MHAVDGTGSNMLFTDIACANSFSFFTSQAAVAQQARTNMSLISNNIDCLRDSIRWNRVHWCLVFLKRIIVIPSYAIWPFSLNSSNISLLRPRTLLYFNDVQFGGSCWWHNRPVTTLLINSFNILLCVVIIQRITYSIRIPRYVLKCNDTGKLDYSCEIGTLS